MKCNEIFEALSDFIDEELSQSTCDEIQRHLDHCHNCRIVVNTLRKTVTLYHSMPRQEMPGEVRTRLHHVISIEGLGGK
jgi:anti-sigma factor RsiW